MLQVQGAGEASRDIDVPGRTSACRFVEALVAVAMGVSIADLRRPSRGSAPVAFARQAAMYLAHVQFGLTLEQAGQHFGRDRTTAAHACRRIEDKRDDPRFERVVVCLEAAIQWWQRNAGTGGQQ